MLDLISPLLRHLDKARQARSDRLVRLLDGIDCRRRLRRQESAGLLEELTPHIRAARAEEREQDRRLARRFNAFRYLRDDELGLSRIIADLLDPNGDHGQGAAFLDLMVEVLGIGAGSAGSGRASGPRLARLAKAGDRDSTVAAPGGRVRVQSERGIPRGRRIDLTVEVPTDDGPFCLAFENKPYATDQPGQCRDYLAFLDDAYCGRFLLVYLPARYRMPEESSLPSADRERWKDRFRVLPYWREDWSSDDDASSSADEPSGDGGPSDGSGEASFGNGAASLADWFGACRDRCEAERLQWFLVEARLFCQRHFGESNVTDMEARYVRQYLRENPQRLHSAFAVARAWPEVMHDVCRRFLEQLRDRIAEGVLEAFPEIADELDVGCHYGGDKNWSNYLRVYRRGWVRYETDDVRSHGRTAVMLECGKGGPMGWGVGVRNAIATGDMSEVEKRLRREVEALLERQGMSVPTGRHWPHWPYWEAPRHGDWTTRVPELAQELADGGGPITDHYVNRFLDIASKAIPAIDEVELNP